jgi:hypothetical protein
MGDLVARQQQAHGGAHRGITVRAQFGSQRAQAAAVVVGRVDQVA